MTNFLERMNATASNNEDEADDAAVYAESGDASINGKIEDSRRRRAEAKAQYQRQCEAYYRWRRGEQGQDGDAYEYEALVAYAPFDPAVVRDGGPGVRIAAFVAADADLLARVRAAVADAGIGMNVDVIRVGDPCPSVLLQKQRDAAVVLFLLPGFRDRAERQWLFETVRFAGFETTNYANFAMLYAGATADDHIWVLFARAGASANDWQRRWLKKIDDGP